MGGGNLNLKKSWHPSTLKNQERVWKAQQQDESEKRKLEELRKELQTQREKEEFQNIADRASGSTEPKTKMDWMYKGVTALVDREDYLLGRKVDKTFDVIKAAEDAEEKGLPQPGEKSEGLPSQLFKKRQTEADFVPVDMAIKVREDPLYLIKKQEYESKKQLLSNPVKMKMLQEMISSEKGGKGHKKSKKKKHKKDKKKHKRQGDEATVTESEDSSEAEDVPKHRRDAELPQRNKADESTDYSQRRGSPSNRSGKDSRYHRERPAHIRRNSRERDRSRSPRRDRGNYDRKLESTSTVSRSSRSGNDQSRDRDDSRSRHRSGRSDRDRSPRSKTSTKYDSTGSTDSRSANRRDRRDAEDSADPPRSSPPRKEGYGLIKTREDPSEDQGSYAKKDYRQILEERRRKEEQERRELKERLKNRTAHKLSQEEREARLREMQDDAVRREKQREQYVQRHTKGDAIHVDGYEEGGFRGAEMLSKAVDESSVERRLKSRMTGLKRSGRAMETNFLRK